MNDNSLVVCTDWQTKAGDSVIVPIRIDVSGRIGVYNNINSVFDAYNSEYASDLLRDGNVLYTRNGKNIQELLSQRRQVPKVIRSDVSSGNSVAEASDVVKFSAKDPVEKKGTLLAIHNLTEEKLKKFLALGGAPMPSIASSTNRPLTRRRARRTRSTLPMRGLPHSRRSSTKRTRRWITPFTAA